MAKAKKNQNTKTARTPAVTKERVDLGAEARPVGQGKDPLTEGNTLANPSNTEAATHYEVRQRSEDVRRAFNAAKQGADEGESAVESADFQVGVSTSSIPDSSRAEQDRVAEGRTE